MAETPDNHTIALLQEMRREMRERFDEIGRRFEHVNQRFDEIDARFDGVDARIDGVTHIMTLIAGHQYALESRVEALEDADKTEA
jgi:tetrahydromethanopterin S-methyltransferase subunit G